jgi:lipoprotein-anchoring transpeptidase ErfK/SrfK
VGVSGLTRGTWVAVGVGALALACGSAFAGVQYANRVEVQDISPAPGSAVATVRPLIAINTGHVVGMRDLHVTIDGKDRTGSVGRHQDGQLVMPAANLSQGVHTVEVRFRSRNVFSRTVDRSWSFTVDTKLPSLAVTAPKPDAEVATRNVPLAGRSEPNARVTATWKGGQAATVADARGAWSMSAPVPEGKVGLKVVAADHAGNAAVTARTVTADTSAPSLTLDRVPAKLTTTDAPVFTGTFSGESPQRVVIGATVNGRRIVALKGATGHDAGGEPVAGVTFTGRRFALSLGRIPQGRNTVKVFVSDPAGNTATKAVAMTVNSTDEFGTRDLVPGARGADVKELQRQLVDRGFKRTRVTGLFDAQTARSIKHYQRVHHLTQSGLFTQRTRTAFVGRIVVTLSKFQLRLIQDGKVVAQYKVAVGQPAFPTPTGTFRIVNKQRDPTWTPPPGSSWAKGLGPIPAGPGNPLGTRWMGTSAPFVGIHGTYADSSIGTRASHGCIRMHIKDVEALYDLVSVGMTVELRA